MKDNFELAIEYTQEFIDKHKPISTAIQIKYYNSGVITEGHNGRTFISFEDWKKLKRNAKTK